MRTRNFIRIAPLFWWLAVVALFGVAVMLLWNCLVTSIFGLMAISYWQALGLLILVRLLFGGIGIRNGMMEHHSKMHKDNPVHQRWMEMTPEERKEFIKKKHKHIHRGMFGRHNFGFDPDNDLSKSDE